MNYYLAVGFFFLPIVGVTHKSIWFHTTKKWLEEEKVKATHSLEDLNILKASSFARKETGFKWQSLLTFSRGLYTHLVSSASTCHNCVLREDQRWTIYTPCLKAARVRRWGCPASWGERQIFWPAISAQTSFHGHLGTAVLSPPCHHISPLL